jgi:hypothetical protein
MKMIGNTSKLENEIILPVFNSVEENIKSVITSYMNSDNESFGLYS